MSELAGALIKTIEQQEAWDEALAALCASVGAIRALVTLRDLRTAEIYVPTSVADTHGSPLIYGFEPPEVFSYLSDYMADDPWTEIEQRHPPVEPYAMSSYLPPERLRETRLWTWLAPLGIGDAIACEIGRTDLHRTVMNLFLPVDAEPGHARTAIEQLAPLLPLVRMAWASGRRFHLQQLSHNGLAAVLAAISRPAIVASSEGWIEACNDAARHQFANWGIELAPGAPLSLPAWMTVHTGEWPDLVPIDRVPYPPRSSMVATISPYAASELCNGEPVRWVLMTLDPVAAETIWDVLELTPKERELVRYLAQGLTHKAAAFEMGRSYPRIMQLWRSARDKLGVSDVNDLRVRHRLERLRRETQGHDPLHGL